MPNPFGKPFQMTILVNADCAIIVFMGYTPVAWSTKRKGAVTYHTEFAVLKEATEQAIIGNKHSK